MHCHTQSPSHAGARGVADDGYRGGVGDKMEDWVKCLHQTGKRQRLRYCTVQNPVVCSLAREIANSHNMHPYVIAQTDQNKRGEQAQSGEAEG